MARQPRWVHIASYLSGKFIVATVGTGLCVGLAALGASAVTGVAPATGAAGPALGGTFSLAAGSPAARHSAGAPPVTTARQAAVIRKLRQAPTVRMTSLLVAARVIAGRAAAKRVAAARTAAARSAALREAVARAARQEAAHEAPPRILGRRLRRVTAHQAGVSHSAAPSGTPREIAEQLLADQGLSGQFSCLDALWEHESGWNVYAENPSSGAYGIPQALPGAQMASAGPDWRSNATTQIRWGLGYVEDRYGSPCGAWYHEEAHGWY